MKRNKKGFTIVELVIVIGVIGILSAILIPTFVTLTDRANKARAQSEVAGVYSAYLIEAGEQPKGQKEVVIERENEKFVFGNEGWTVDADAVKGAQLFDNGNNNGTAEAGEIVVYVKG